MPTITLNRKVLNELIGKELVDEYLKETIPYIGTPIEEMNEDSIVIEVAPNRPDMLSEQGFARAYASFIGEKTGLRKYDIKDSERKVVIEESVQKVRPFTACAIVSNLEFDDEKIREIIQIQEKLHVTYGRNRKKVAIGIYPSEKITYPIRFVAKNPDEIRFQPLEFPKTITARQILSQHTTGREYGHLLEGLETYPFFIDAKDKVLSMPPIINSHDVGKISEDTKEVFIECSGFDYQVLSKCLNMIVTALADMGGHIKSMTLEYPDKKIKSPNLDAWKMKYDVAYVNKITGLKLSEKDCEKLLEKMGFGTQKEHALVPAYRSDILHQIDLVEDIAIAYGYNNIKEVIPKVATIGKIDEFYSFKQKIVDILIGFGFYETNTYCIINKDEQTKLMDIPDDEVIELKNSVSIEYNSLRKRMLPSMMIVLRNNRNNEYPQNIFETGRVFQKDHDEHNTGVKEEEKLCVTLCGQDTDYTKIRQILDAISTAINHKFVIEKNKKPYFIQGRCGQIMINNQKIGNIGEISPQTITNFGIEMPAAALEINMTRLFEEFQRK